MSKLIKKSHNATLLLYHIVCPIKYRRNVISDSVDDTITNTCLNISDKYEIHFIEIGTDKNHVHFLIQSVPKYSPTQLVTIIKSFVARNVFQIHPEVKKQLWGGEFWTDGYYVSTVSQKSTEDVVREYVSQQGNASYSQLHKDNVLTTNE